MESNSNFTSVLASAKYGGVPVPPQVDYVVDAVVNSGPWTILFTVLAILVAYDQSKKDVPRPFKPATRVEKRWEPY